MNRPYKTPFWVKLFAFFSVCLLLSMLISRSWRESQRNALTDRVQHERAAQRKRAEELAAEGYEKLRMAQRNQLYLLCREVGNYPLFFIDKVVCLKPESIVWVKYDGNPEQDTSSGGASSE